MAKHAMTIWPTAGHELQTLAGAEFSIPHKYKQNSTLSKYTTFTPWE